MSLDVPLKRRSWLKFSIRSNQSASPLKANSATYIDDVFFKRGRAKTGIAGLPDDVALVFLASDSALGQWEQKDDKIIKVRFAAK
jgi:hypothetical protein